MGQRTDLRMRNPNLADGGEQVQTFAKKRSESEVEQDRAKRVGKEARAETMKLMCEGDAWLPEELKVIGAYEPLLNHMEVSQHLRAALEKIRSLETALAAEQEAAKQKEKEEQEMAKQEDFTKVTDHPPQIRSVSLSL